MPPAILGKSHAPDADSAAFLAMLDAMTEAELLEAVEVVPLDELHRWRELCQIDDADNPVEVLPLSVHAAMLARLQPRDYAERPPPDEPEIATLRRTELVEVRAQRAASGESLWHPLDLVKVVPDLPGVGHEAHRRRNGSDEVGSARAIDHASSTS